MAFVRKVRVLDVGVVGLIVEVRKFIIEHLQDEDWGRKIGGLETGVNWFHGDVRDRLKGKIILFGKPTRNKIEKEESQLTSKPKTSAISKQLSTNLEEAKDDNIEIPPKWEGIQMLQASVGRPTTRQQTDRKTEFKIVNLRPKRTDRKNG